MSNPDSPRDSSPLHLAVMWLVILVSTGIIAADNFHSPYSTSAAAGSAAPDEMPNIGVEMASRYVVGATTLASAHPERQQQMLTRLSPLAKTSADELRLAIVAGRLQGAPAAMARLKSLRDPGLRRDADDLLQLYNAGADSLSAAQRQRLVARYGWFGKLALAQGAPPGSPAERSALAPAMRTVYALGAAAFLFLVTFALGLVLCMTAIVRLIRGKVQLAFTPPIEASVPLVESFALYVAAIAAVGILLRRWQGPSGVAGTVLHTAILLAVALVPLLWPLLRGLPAGPYRQAIGWHAGQGVLREMGVGIVAYIGGLPILALGVILAAVLSNYTGIQPVAHPVVRAIGQSTGQTIGLFLLASVYAPIAEETLFRGALFAHLRGRFGWLISASVVSFIFAALHPQGVAAIPILFAIAFVFAALREWRGSILPSITAHAINNAVVLLLLTVCLSS